MLCNTVQCCAIACRRQQTHTHFRFEGQIVSQLVSKFPSFYSTQSFVTVFTTDRHCLCPEQDQSSPQPPVLFPRHSVLPSTFHCYFECSTLNCIYIITNIHIGQIDAHLTEGINKCYNYAGSWRCQR